MAYEVISPTEINPGKPTSTTVADKIRTNLDDHEDRLQVLEEGIGVTYPPLIMRVNGDYSIPGAYNGVLKTTTNFPIQVTGIRILIDTAGSSGTTEVDVKYKRGAAAYVSMLTTKPSVASSAGNDALSTNGVVDPTHSTLEAGDIIRLDTTSVQVNPSGFLVRIDYTRG